MYQASNLGQIKSLERIFIRNNKFLRIYKEKIKKQCETSKRNSKQGYLCTRLIDKNGKSKSELVHILIARTFIPNPLSKPTVNHKDGNKHNNNIKNLEWNTYSENNSHAIRIGLREKYIGKLRNYKDKGVN